MKFKYLSYLLILGLYFIACSTDDDGRVIEECDDQNVTYTNGAAAIVNGSCAIEGCHASGSTTTFPMGNYTETVDAARVGRIIGAINHDAGFSPMPYPVGTSKLDPCDIIKLTAWINEGTVE